MCTPHAIIEHSHRSTISDADAEDAGPPPSSSTPMVEATMPEILIVLFVIHITIWLT